MTWFPDKASCNEWGGPEFRFPFTRETFLQDTNVESVPSWVLVDRGGGIAGFGQYYLRLGRCHLARVAVAPRLRGQGIGSILINELCRKGTSELGAATFSLFVLPGNRRARRLYQRLGFAETPYPEPATVFEGCVYMVRSGVSIDGPLAQPIAPPVK